MDLNIPSFAQPVPDSAEREAAYHVDLYGVYITLKKSHDYKLSNSFQDNILSTNTFKDTETESVFTDYYDRLHISRETVGLAFSLIVCSLTILQWLPLLIFAPILFARVVLKWKFGMVIPVTLTVGYLTLNYSNLLLIPLLLLVYIFHPVRTKYYLFLSTALVTMSQPWKLDDPYKIILVILIWIGLIYDSYTSERILRAHFYSRLQDEEKQFRLRRRFQGTGLKEPPTEKIVRMLRAIKESGNTTKTHKNTLAYVTDMLTSTPQLLAPRFRLPTNVDPDTAAWVKTELVPRSVKARPHSHSIAVSGKHGRTIPAPSPLSTEQQTSGWDNVRESMQTDRLMVASASDPNLHLPGTMLPLEASSKFEKEFEKGWNIDMWYIHSITKARPLFFIAKKLFERHGLCETLHVEEDSLNRWLVRIEAGYHKENPYHNSTHAADVLLCTEWILTRPGVREAIDNLDLFSALLAACSHDYEHTGRSNGFLVATSHDMAINYNDMSVQEMHHGARAAKLLQETGVLKSFTKDDSRRVRDVMLSMILATDMAAKHLELLGSFTARLASGEFNARIEDENSNNEADRALLLQIVLKCADLCHTAKPVALHRTWTEHVLNEFWEQGDKEMELGMSISPFMDRKRPQVAKSQMGFFSFAIQPLYSALSDVVSEGAFDCVMENIDANMAMWKEKIDQEEAAATPADQ